MMNRFIRMSGADWNELFDALSIPLSPDLRRRVMEMRNRVENSFRESDLNPERFYFRQELVNGIFEDELKPPEIRG